MKLKVTPSQIYPILYLALGIVVPALIAPYLLFLIGALLPIILWCLIFSFCLYSADAIKKDDFNTPFFKHKSSTEDLHWIVNVFLLISATISFCFFMVILISYGEEGGEIGTEYLNTFFDLGLQIRQFIFNF